MQLVDELSMIYTACLMCYATFSFSQSRLFRQLLAAGLVSVAAFITVSLTRHRNAGVILTLPSYTIITYRIVSFPLNMERGLVG